MDTVTTTPIDGHRALLFHWTRDPDTRDVRAAFQHMTALLERAERPLWVVVDVSANPRFPITETITDAFWGPFRSKKLAEWLVVGSSSIARTIGQTLMGISRRENIRWFHTMDEALAYLAQAEARDEDG